MEKVFAIVVMVIGAIVTVARIGLLLAFPIKWCWNYVMPYLFDFKTITWGQAWCLHFVAGSLIKSTLQNNKGN